MTARIIYPIQRVEEVGANDLNAIDLACTSCAVVHAPPMKMPTIALEHAGIAVTCIGFLAILALLVYRPNPEPLEN